MLNLYTWLLNAHTVKQLLLFAIIVFTLTVPYLIILLKKNPRTPSQFPKFILKYKNQLISGQIIVIVSLIGLLILPAPIIISPSLPIFDPVNITYYNPLILTFDRPVSSDITVTIKPHVPGEWKLEKVSYPIFNHQLAFYPSQSLASDTEYMIQIDRILPLTWFWLKTANNTLFVINTPTPPDVERISPQDGQAAFKVDQPFTIHFDRPSPKNVEWSYALSPSVNNNLAYSAERDQIIITPQLPLNHNTKYRLTIYRTPLTYDYLKNIPIQTQAKEKVLETTFTTVKAASVKKIQPSGQSVLPNEIISIAFEEPMNKLSTENAINISPSTPIDYFWSNNSELTILPRKSWELDTSYSLNIDSTAESDRGGYITDGIIHTFKTIGKVNLIDSNPGNNAINHPIDQPITITFNQPVDPKSTQGKFSINPEIEGEIAWDDNSLIFTPSVNFAYQSLYTIKLAAGIKSKYGSDSELPINISFNTAPQEIILNIPQVRQSQVFTCYAAAAQMALEFKSINSLNQTDIINQIGYDSTSRSFAANSWGDPNQAIVGTLDGSHPGGYGVHWDPIAKVLNQYTQSEVKRNWNITELLAEINNGNPVIVWWINGVWPAKVIAWHTPSGEDIYAVNGMHVEVVKGYTGTVGNPQYIITNDPWRGERRYNQEAFNDLWRWFSNTAIVVR